MGKKQEVSVRHSSNNRNSLINVASSAVGTSEAVEFPQKGKNAKTNNLSLGPACCCHGIVLHELTQAMGLRDEQRWNDWVD